MTTTITISNGSDPRNIQMFNLHKITPNFAIKIKDKNKEIIINHEEVKKRFSKEK